MQETSASKASLRLCLDLIFLYLVGILGYQTCSLASALLTMFASYIVALQGSASIRVGQMLFQAGFTTDKWQLLAWRVHYASNKQGCVKSRKGKSVYTCSKWQNPSVIVVSWLWPRFLQELCLFWVSLQVWCDESHQRRRRCILTASPSCKVLE